MRFCLSFPYPGAFFAAVVSLLLRTVSAVRIIESSALEECQSSSNLTASLLNVIFTPDNSTVDLNVVGNSFINGNVTLLVEVSVYGYTFLTETLDPCALGLLAMCPLTPIPLSFHNIYPNLSGSIISRIPSIAYGIPDLDATVTIHIRSVNNANMSLACVRTRLSNLQTVNQAGVGWATAFVAGGGLLTSALVSGLGNHNAASHISVYTLSLFSYFQAVAIIGMCAVPLPPIVQSWTQDFSWSMGIINVGFLQRLAAWYQIATGGTSDTLLATLGTTSVQVVKRSLDRRASADALLSGGYIVKGIKRVAFRANMESTNVFLTSLIFLCIFVTFTLFGVVLFKLLCGFAIRKGWMESQRFRNLRENYRVTLKGIALQSLLICYPQMTILCLWEFTQIDSPAVVVLAVLVFFGMSAALILAATRVIQFARSSEQQHKTPAYMLYANATILNKWGFLYIQFRASAYYYVAASLVYILMKGMFVALAQKSGTTQAIALVVIEAVALLSAAWIRPWMDKSTNSVNIAVCSINFVNAVFLLLLTGISRGPGLIVGVTGVVFFIVNAIFVLVLLFYVLIVATYSFIQKNPEKRYQTITDNRASFIRSQTGLLPTEVVALGAAARGSGVGEKIGYQHSHEQLGIFIPDNHDSLSNPSVPFLVDDQQQSESDLRSPPIPRIEAAGARDSSSLQL